MTKILTHWTIAFLTLAAITFYGLQEPYLKEVLRLKGFDTIITSQEKTYSQDIIVVEIDEKAIEKYGQYPFNREVYADLIYKLRDQGAGMIIFPMLFSEEDRLGGESGLEKTKKPFNGVINNTFVGDGLAKKK